MQREKLYFEPGVPVQAKLDKTTSKPIESRNGGTEYMRVLDDDERILFAPEALENAITESGAEAGDLIQITQIGTGKRARWDVAIIGDQQQEPPAQPARPAAPPARQPFTSAAPQRAQLPAGPVATRREITDDAAEFASAFSAAIEACLAATEYAAHAGIRDLHMLTPDAVRATATTIYITRTQRKAGR